MIANLTQTHNYIWENGKRSIDNVSFVCFVFIKLGVTSLSSKEDCINNIKNNVNFFQIISHVELLNFSM